MFTRTVLTTVVRFALAVFLFLLLGTPTQGYCDDDTLRSTYNGDLVFNDGRSTVGNDGLVEVKTNDPKCPKILWYPPLGHFICMPPDVAVGNGEPSSGRNSSSRGGSNANTGRSSKR